MSDQNSGSGDTPSEDSQEGIMQGLGSQVDKTSLVQNNVRVFSKTNVEQDRPQKVDVNRLSEQYGKNQYDFADPLHDSSDDESVMSKKAEQQQTVFTDSDEEDLVVKLNLNKNDKIQFDKGNH